MSSAVAVSAYDDMVQQSPARATRRQSPGQVVRPDWCSLSPAMPLGEVEAWERVMFVALLPVRLVSLGVLWATSSTARFAVMALLGLAAFLVVNGVWG